ncbi:MAG TPA: translation initiation factor IF-2 N-terminal domain-containing protein, partial [Rhodanobacteraceae bacterium]|nr:translation initiation factor IF-2 N-terminal domain-containing protein [Rhodanobacteraceae bacterium]
MSDVTIKQLAKVLDMSADKLLAQLGEAGMQFSDPDEVVSNDEKSKLLDFLRRNHGKGDKSAAKSAGPSKITLRRRQRSELKVSTGSGRSATSKTVNVEVRAKRTYVKRGAMTDDADAVQEREEAQRKLQEAQEQRQREELEREEQKQRREEAARQEAEAKAAEQARQADAAEASEPAPAAPEETAPESAAEPAEEATPADETVNEPATEPEAATSDAEVSGEDKSAWSTPVMPRLHERRKRREKPAVAKEAQPEAPKEAAAAKTGRGGARRDRTREHEKGENEREKRFGSGKLHLTESERARRGSGRRRKSEAARPSAASGAHGFSKPTAPVVREVSVGDANLVSELAQKMAVKGAEVVKALFKMGVMATINQTIDHDTAALVVEELGHQVVEAEDKGAEATLLE